MRRTLSAVIGVVTLLSWSAAAQDGKTILDSAAKAIGAGDLRSIQFRGSGFNFALGQSLNHRGSGFPKFNTNSYVRVVDYDTVSSREEQVRTQALDPPIGGAIQPIVGEQRLIALVSGTHAWNVAGSNAVAAPATLRERLLQIWSTPHGFIKAAMGNNATVKQQTVGGRKVSVVSFTMPGNLKLEGTINNQNLVERVKFWVDNPVLGDMLVEVAYSQYKDFNGVKFPTKIVDTRDGWPVTDLTITEVQPNAPANITVPDNVKTPSPPPPVRVTVKQVADGVWHLAGGSHHTVVVEFNDHVVAIDGPQNEARSLAVIAEVRKLAPNKPIKYLVNTHHHFDHSGGVRTYAAEGATLITHQTNKPYFEKAYAVPRTLNPDNLSQSGKKAKIETVNEKRVLTDGSRTLELHVVKNTHSDGLIVAYLPKEKILVEADLYQTAPLLYLGFARELNQNIERLKLDVTQVLPIHGEIFTLADLQKAVAQAPARQ